MKKILSFMLIALLALGLVGCQSSTPASTEGTTTEGTTTEDTTSTTIHVYTK